MNKRKLKLIILLILTTTILQSCYVAGGFNIEPALDNVAVDQADIKEFEQVENRDGYTLYAENKKFELWVDPAKAVFTLVDKQGEVWHSTPKHYHEDPIAQDVVKQAMASIIHVLYADRLGNINSINCWASSIEKGGLSVSPIEDGVRMDFVFDREGFEIPVEVKLFDEGIEVSLVADEIEEKNLDYSLVRVALNPYFGAADQDAQGYMFVPDGSGALINLDGNSSFKDTYSQYVYGRDPSSAGTDRRTVTQDIKMPVFGMKNSDNAFLAIITEGEARASINAGVTGARSSYSNAYAEFVYRDFAMTQIEGKIQTVRIFEQNPINPDRYSVKYYFLNNEEASYTGMALRYQDYLIEEKGLEKTTEEFTSMFLELYGGVTAKVYDWGIPINKVIELTTYEDALGILEYLKDKGIDDIVIDYKAWDKGGTSSPVPTSIRPERRLGGKREFEELLTFASSKGLYMFLDINLTDIKKNSWSHNRLFHSATSVQRSPVIQSSYHLNTFQDDMKYSNFLLMPGEVLDLADSLATQDTDYDIAGFVPSTLGNKLYSDFGTVSRYETQKLWSQALAKLYGKTDKLLLNSPNAYAFPYTTYIGDTPTSSSGFLVEYQEVPFYQIVLRGIIPMSVPALNTMSDPHLGVLKAIETGLSIKYQWTADNEEILIDTDLNYLKGTNYKAWMDDAVANHKEVVQVLDKIGDSRIIDHEIITGSLSKTEFENGVTVIVNYGSTEAEYQGIKIGGESYYVSESD